MLGLNVADIFRLTYFKASSFLFRISFCSVFS